MSQLKPTPSGGIDVARLRALVIDPGGLWQQVNVVKETGSTNADLAQAARLGESPGSVLLTDTQRAGRGRLGRTFTTPPGTAIALSMLVQPRDVEGSPLAALRWTWLPLLAGMAVSEALQRACGVEAVLKWPNDVLIGGRKVCGILSERVETPTGPACVIGIGINVGLAETDLPVPTATSLAIEGASTLDLTSIAATVLRAFALLFEQWRTMTEDTAFAGSYLRRCSTIGKPVRVVLPDDQSVEGVAESIDDHGRLLVRTPEGLQSFGAGDVVHLR